MSTLAAQQQALLAALFHMPAENATETIAAYPQYTGARGLKAYQANGHALAERVLRAAYPVVTQLLGDESMADLARAMWHAHPPTCGDMAHWGAGLPEFVSHSEQLRDEPYLADVAAAEWALHRCATAPDALFGAAPDIASFTLLAEHDPGAAPAFAGDSGRYFAFGHGGLIRRPLKGDWAISIPCAADELGWVKEALKAHSSRITVRDMAETISIDEGVSKGQAPLVLDVKGFLSQ